MSSFVYLLPHRSEPRFKVGKANDLESRISKLGTRKFDFGRAVVLELATAADSLNVERMLHRALHRSRLAAESGDELFPGLADEGDGATEWFDIHAFERCLELVRHCQDLHEYKTVEGVELGRELSKNLALTSEQWTEFLASEGELRLLRPPVPRPAMAEPNPRWRFVELHDDEAALAFIKFDIAQAETALAELRGMCAYVARLEGPHGAVIVGLGEPENSLRIKELLRQLMRVSFICGRGSASPFPSFESMTLEDGSLAFSLATVSARQLPAPGHSAPSPVELGLSATLAIQPGIAGMDLPLDETDAWLADSIGKELSSLAFTSV